MKNDEILKCKNDIFYFIENYIKIKSHNTNKLECLKLNSFQKEFLSNCVNDRLYVASARQNGTTTAIISYSLYKCLLDKNFTSIVINVKNTNEFKDIFRLIQDILPSIPDFFPKKVIKLSKNCIIFENGSSIEVCVIGDEEYYIEKEYYQEKYPDILIETRELPALCLDIFTSTLKEYHSMINTKIIITSIPKYYSQLKCYLDMKGYNFKSYYYNWSYNPHFSKNFIEELKINLGRFSFEDEFGII